MMYLILQATLLLLSLSLPSRAIILCDGDCMDNLNLEICRPFNDSRKPIYVMAFFPCNTGTFRARGLTVAAQMAIRAVHNHSTILQDYSLRLAFNNTKCDRLSATRAFINQLGETRHMIIGPGCSSGAVTVADISPFYNLTQISYTATSISLSDKGRFPNFLRTISSDNASIDTITAVVREYGWRQVAVVTEMSELYSNLTTELAQALINDDVKVITEGLRFAEEDDPATVIQHLNTTGARVVILNVFEDSARKLFCLAYHRGMIFPHYLFISYYQYSEFWWSTSIQNFSPSFPDLECNAEMLTDAIYRSLAVDYFPMPTAEENNTLTDVGYNSPFEFWNDFLFHLDSLNYKRSEALRQAMYVYDAVWAAAFALNSAAEKLRAGQVDGISLSLEDFNYSRHDINELILNSTRSLQFQGVSGKVKFNQFGDREPTRQIFQYIYDTVVDPEDPDMLLTPFARVSEETQKLVYEPGMSIEDVFPDGTPQAVEEVFVHPALFGIYTVLSCLGICFAVACLIFNLVFKDKKIVKLSSPYLNILILLGAILFYIDVILFGVDENVASQTIVDINCQATIWLASIGFSLLFGTMLAKTWRVYYIFRSVELKKKPMKDWVLFIIVAVILAFDVVFLIVVSVDVWRLRLRQELVIRSGGAIPQVVGNCDSDASTYWLPILLAYKGLYLIVGLWLAATTYRVKIKQLRDSKLIVASVVSISLVSLVLTLVTFLLPTLPNLTYGVIGSFILVLLTSVLFLLFVTRMIELYRDSSGEVDITSGQKATNTKTAVIANIASSAEDENKIAELRNTIESLKSQIQEAKNKKGRAAESQETREDVVTSEDEGINATDSVAHLLDPGCEENVTKSTINFEMTAEQEKLKIESNEVHGTKF